MNTVWDRWLIPIAFFTFGCMLGTLLESVQFYRLLATCQ